MPGIIFDAKAKDRTRSLLEELDELEELQSPSEIYSRMKEKTECTTENSQL